MIPEVFLKMNQRKYSIRLTKSLMFMDTFFWSEIYYTVLGRSPW